MLLAKHIDGQELINELQTILNEFHRYASTVDLYVITSSTDLTGNITSVSTAFCEISGYTEEELIGQNHNIVRHPDTPVELYEDMWTTIQAGRSWNGEVKNLKKDGDYYWVDVHIDPVIENGEITGYLAIRQDITDRKRIEDISVTDDLTGAFNRRHFDQTLQVEMERAKRENFFLNMLMIDADNFKKYNDTYGHQAGDKILQEIVKAMKNTFRRAGDNVYRLGGEEFAVLFHTETPENAFIISDRLRQNIYDLNLDHTANKPQDRVTVSCGLMTIDPNITYIEEEIYKYADTALYLAKQNGRNRIEVHEEGEVELF